MPILLERQHELAVLREAVAAAAARRGSVVEIAGEAGMGKSALLDTWRAEAGTELHELVGWCDDLLTKRALGPLRDIARVAGGAVATAVADLDTGDVLDALLTVLDDPLRPTVLVLEDVHWADDATLDVVRYVGRRIEQLPAVLVITYREDELGSDHPLLSVLGALREPVHRLSLRPLSAQAVAQLTDGLDLDPDEVRRVTAGNPFFVSEIARGVDELPASVFDALRARVIALPAGPRAALELLSVLPGGADHGLVAALQLDPADIAIAEARGLLTVDERLVRFRHEIGRRAIRAALPVAARIAHHRRVLEQLLHGEDEAAILHHAIEAGRGEVVAAHGPRAAHEAYRAGAYREALGHQHSVLAFAEPIAPDVHVELLEEHAWTLSNLHRVDEAVEAAARAVRGRAELGDPVAHGRALTVLARMHQLANDPAAAMAAAEAAVDLLEQFGDAEQRAEGIVARAYVYALRDDPVSLPHASEAVALTDPLPRPDLRSLALGIRAMTRCASGLVPDVDDLREAVRLALESGHLELAARAYSNLTFELMMSREPSLIAMPVLEEALSFLEDHDFVAHAFAVRARRATVMFTLGRWDEAEHELRELRSATAQHGVVDVLALESLSRIALRRGDEDAEVTVSRAWRGARRSGAVPYLGTIGVIRVEQAWLAGNHADVSTILAEIPIDRLRPRLRAEILRYAQLAGAAVEPPGELPDPWASGLHGDWKTAAAAWRHDRRPYELAVELLASGDVEPIRESIQVFDELGARPAARLARQRLRDLGVRRIPRGPQARTREHPAGLTARQAEVFAELAEGLTNAQIAERLVVSVRTVDHHVAAILQKLGVSSRREAVGHSGSFDPGWR